MLDMCVCVYVFIYDIYKHVIYIYITFLDRKMMFSVMFFYVKHLFLVAVLSWRLNFSKNNSNAV